MGRRAISVGFAGTERFVVEDKLGEGAMGSVYRVYDRERDHRVALKTLTRMEPGALYRFKQEFRSLAGVTHRNLVTLYELISEGDRWFFTMELICGAPFLDYLRGEDPPEPTESWTTPGPAPRARGKATVLLDESAATLETSPTLTSVRRPGTHPQPERLRPAFTQLAEGLQALHSTGHLHRDIKPSNILVTAEHRVVILDFGVVAPATDRDGALRCEDPAGTPAYMAPEATVHGATLTAACDWYSMGVILYEALTGLRPFRGSVEEILEAKQKHDAPPALEIDAEAPPDLSSLCADLLRRDPAARPAAAQVMNRLRSPTARAVWRPPEIATTEGPGLLIGRERELEELHSGFGQAERGEGVAMFVVGESGMGKSSLAQHFLHQVAAERQTVVLTGRCHEGETVPYKAVDSLVDSLCQYLVSLPRHMADSLMPLDVHELARVFPVLRRVEAVSDARRRSAAVAQEPTELRSRAFAALRELFARIAARSPLVLYIDDLQWGDVDSAPLLADLMKPPTPPLVLLGSYRSEVAESSALLRALFAPDSETALEPARRRDIRVRRLALPHARELAGFLLEEADAPVGLAERIARESGGNPFFINELVRFAATPGASQDPKAMTMEAVLGARMAALTNESRNLLEVIAVAAVPTPQSVIRRAARVGEAEPRAFAELRSGRWIRSTGSRDTDRVECYHDRIREASLHTIADARRRELHLRVARSLETSRNPDPRALAFHFFAAEERVSALEYAVQAGDEAAQALAFEAAAELYLLALEVLAEDAEEALRRDLEVKLGDALTNAGRGKDAAASYLRAAVGAPLSLALELRRKAAFQLLRSGHIDDGAEVLRTVLEDFGYALTSSPTRVVASLLAQRARLRVRGLGFHLRDASQLATNDLLRIDACWTAAVGLAPVDTIRAAEFGSRMLRLGLRSGEPLRIARALLLEGGFVATRGTSARRRAWAILDRVRPIDAQLNDPALHGWLLGTEAFVHYQLGEFEKARARAQEAGEFMRARTVGTDWERTEVDLYRLWSLFYLGDVGELARLVPQLITEARRRGDLLAAAGLQTGLPNLTWITRDEPVEARRRAAEAMSLWTRDRFLLQHCWNLYAEAHCDLYEGSGRAAYDRLVESWPALSRSMLLRIQVLRAEMLHLRARAALAAAAAATDPELLLREAERSARRLSQVSYPIGRPLAQLVRAGAASLRGDTDAALAAAREAEGQLASRGCALLARVARRRQGQLLGGDEGAALVAEADAWLRERDVASPDRFAHLFDPGSG